MSTQLLLEAKGIKKSYGAVQALRGVDFRVARGETVALVGDNGAGKSTLVKVLSGVVNPTEGEILFEGRRVSIDTPDVARDLGIETVYQDLGLCDNMSVSDNIFLGRELVWQIGPFRLLNKRAMRKATDEVLAGLAVNVPGATANVLNLSGGQRQAVALARAKLWERAIVLFDEPTAALGVQESRKAMDIIRKMQAQGLSCVLIAHNIPMVMEMSHRVVVLRHGTKVGDVATKDLTEHDIVALITGARQEWIQPDLAATSATAAGNSGRQSVVF